jgi:hypothetical protein
MFGSLKGFAKFLKDSPEKDKIQQNGKSFDLKDFPISRVALAEKCFLLYSDQTQKLIYV